MYAAVVFLLLVAASHCAVPLKEVPRRTNRAGYTLYPGVGYYKYYGDAQARTWSEARKICENEDAHLVIINSQTEFDAVHENFQGQQASKYYSFLGFHDLFLEGQFATIYDEPLNHTGYSTWGSQGSNGSSPSDCGAMYQRGYGLYRYDCTASLPFFCEQELWHDYEYFPGVGYYKLQTRGATWGEAWRTCKEEGSDLAVINSQEEYAALQSILVRHPSLNADSDVLISLGFHSKFTNQEYNTISGDYLSDSGFYTWALNEPNANGHCGGVQRNGNLYMGDCAANLAFFCEHTP